MSRQVVLENGRFVVDDDPDGVLAILLGLVAGHETPAEIEDRFAPEGRGFHVQETITAVRAEERDDLPDPWDRDLSLDPAAVELWVVTAERFRVRPRDRHVVLTGDELRGLLARAVALRPSAPGRGIT